MDVVDGGDHDEEEGDNDDADKGRQTASFPHGAERGTAHEQIGVGHPTLLLVAVSAAAPPAFLLSVHLRLHTPRDVTTNDVSLLRAHPGRFALRVLQGVGRV